PGGPARPLLADPPLHRSRCPRRRQERRSAGAVLHASAGGRRAAGPRRLRDGARPRRRPLARRRGRTGAGAGPPRPRPLARPAGELPPASSPLASADGILAVAVRRRGAIAGAARELGEAGVRVALQRALLAQRGSGPRRAPLRRLAAVPERAR